LRREAGFPGRGTFFYACNLRELRADACQAPGRCNERCLCFRKSQAEIFERSPHVPGGRGSDNQHLLQRGRVVGQRVEGRASGRRENWRWGGVEDSQRRILMPGFLRLWAGDNPPAGGLPYGFEFNLRKERPAPR